MSKITIDNDEYKLDDLSDKARSYAEHCHDLQRKIVNTQKDLEQKYRNGQQHTDLEV